MKTTYELESSELKSAIELWMASKGTPVTDADEFTVDASGNVRIIVTHAPSPPVVPSKPHPQPVINRQNFEKAFNWIIKWEGSVYEDVSGDPGGPTKYGIDTKDHPGVDIANLTLAQAEEIYWQSYWLGSSCDKLPTPVAETHFNYSVNTGRAQSVKFMQRSLGIPDDGEYGLATQAALAIADPKEIALKMVNEADVFYQGLAQSRPAMDKFLKGWMNRNSDLRTLILSLSA